MPPSPRFRLWLARILILLVLLDNLQAAVLCLGWPQIMAPGFELSGAAGLAAVQGYGLLFLMWCVPTAVAFWHPIQQKTALVISIAMQTIALVGESILFVLLHDPLPILRLTVQRFILFDGLGLVLLLIALGLVWRLDAKTG